MIWLKNQNEFPACCPECGLDDITYLDLTRGKVESYIDIAAMLIPYTQKSNSTIVVPANSTKIISGCEKFKFLALAPNSKIKFRPVGKYEQNDYLLFFNLIVSSVTLVDDKLNFTVGFTLMDPTVIADYYLNHTSGIGFDNTASYYLKNIANIVGMSASVQVLDTVVGSYEIGFNVNDDITITFKLTFSNALDLNDHTTSDVKLSGPYYYSEKFQPIAVYDMKIVNIKKYYTLEHVYLQHLTGLGVMDSIELFNDTDTDVSVKMVTAS